MVMCYIKNCKNKSGKSVQIINSKKQIRFFSFPKNKSVAAEWLRHCRSNTDKKSDARVCSRHFLPSDYFKSLRHLLMNESPQKLRILKPDAVPSLELGNEELSIIEDMKTDQEMTYFVEISSFENMEPGTNTEVLVKHTGTSTSNREIVSIKREMDSEMEINSVNTKNVVINSEPSDIFIKIPLSEYDNLKARITKLEKMLKHNKDIEEKFSHMKKKLQGIFSPGQIRSLMTNHRIKWCAEDISAAKTLQNVSSNAYEYLRSTVGIPLPNPSTLRRYNMFYIEEGPQNED